MMRYIYCHPLFDERKCTHRFSYQLSEAFKQNGIELERFDYHGTGEAQGQFSDVRMDSLCDDLKSKIGNDTACLIGTKLGASVALSHCCTNAPRVRNLVLIEPVLDGLRYVEYLFKKQHLKDVMTGNAATMLSEKDFYNIEGYKTSSKFIEQIRMISLAKHIESLKVQNSVMIAQVSESSIPDIEITQMVTSMQKNNIKAIVEHFALPPFWERIPCDDYSPLTSKVVDYCRG